jgi:hypothetical protein
VRWPRLLLGAIGAVAIAAAIAVQAPGVFAFTGLAGILAFIVAAGCLAADAIPYRPVHVAAAALSLGDAVLLAVGERTLGIPVLVPALALLLLQPAPSAVNRIRAGRP